MKKELLRYDVCVETKIVNSNSLDKFYLVKKSNKGILNV